MIYQEVVYSWYKESGHRCNLQLRTTGYRFLMSYQWFIVMSCVFICCSSSKQNNFMAFWTFITHVHGKMCPRRTNHTFVPVMLWHTQIVLTSYDMMTIIIPIVIGDHLFTSRAWITALSTFKSLMTYPSNTSWIKLLTIASIGTRSLKHFEWRGYHL